MARWIVCVLVLALAGCESGPRVDSAGVGSGPASPPQSVADRLDRAERMQDWDAVESLSGSFVFSRREDTFAIATVLNGCIARHCDEARAVASLRGPLVTDDVREFAEAWLQYAGRNPLAALPRFEALSRKPGAAWLGVFGRLSYAAGAHNVVLLREAVGEARADPAIAAALGEDLRTAEMSIAALEGDEARVTALARAAGDSTGALMARFYQRLAVDDFAGAEEAARRYEALWGEDQDVTVARIELARARRPPDEVAVAAHRALEAHPGYWRLRIALAQALADAGGGADARGLFAEGLPTEFSAVRLELALFLGSFERFTPQRAATFAGMLKAYRDYPEALAGEASALLRAGRPEEAVELLDRADATGATLPVSLQLRAAIAREADRMDECVRLLERAVALVGRDVDFQLLLGYAYVLAGDPGKAAGVVKALRASPRYVPAESLESLEKAVSEARSR